ncbi:WXG100 family type VII secretion target [Nocardia flavorosea]|uniref:Uncharacterized protein n=1 Tax=Nocardia flavorosea TaxID=53429 RepID=A0A846YR52_9NOCA|nr:hypothetical protein [Nocardia flavorosea]NKY59832.1 hypothetical protein [Nocardia flavorosea]
MLFNYAGVDSTSLNVASLCGGMEENCGRLDGIVRKLNEVLGGDAAEVAHPLMRQFVSDLTNYRSNLVAVREQIDKTTGSEGFMKETDSAQGARFLAIS